jgi:biotin carboxyl carrier protein
MIQEFFYKDRSIEARSEMTGKVVNVSVGGNNYLVTEVSPAKYCVELNGAKTTVCCVVSGDKFHLDVEGLLLELKLPAEDGATSAGVTGHAGEKDKIYAPMPGKIVKLYVKKGDQVREKQAMVIVEAMKMEHQVNAAADGIVKTVNFAEGDQVDTETPIVELDI